ncbi:MAG: TetR/AcrR family transcriptional regulator [Oscillospiraceae bacterium]|nr:TetR/AcrR family transcriptional regulator [Oscillospiraceae bacterium]
MMRISKSPQERKTEIIEAALALFMENGYEGTSVSMIVSKVGVAQGLFYYYFKSKEDVFQSAMEYYTDRLVEDVISELLMPGPRSLAERLGGVSTRLVEMFRNSEGPLTDGMSLHEITDIDMRFSHHISQILIEPVALLLALLCEQSQSELSGKPEALACFIIFGIYGLIHGMSSTVHNTEAMKPELLLPILAGTIGIPIDTLLNFQVTVPEEVLS